MTDDYKDNAPQHQHQTQQDDYEPQVIDFSLVELNREFFDIIDMRFYSVLLGSFIFHFLFIFFFLMNPLSQDMTAKSIAKVQERLAKRLSEQEILETPIAKFEFTESAKQSEEPAEAEAEPVPKKSAEPSSKEQGSGQVPKRPRRGRGGRSQEEIASSVGAKGVLALLSSSSSTASGGQVADILGGQGENDSDLDEALSGLSGVRTSASSGSGQGDPGVKGGRTQGDGSLDGLVSGLGKAKSGSFKRSGDLVLVSDSPLIEKADKRGGAGRNQDDIQAVVLSHNKTIQYCYEKELKRNPSLRGKVVVRFTITPDGTAEDVELVSSDLSNRRVERCILSKVRRWSDFGEVDPSFGNTTVRQAYAFGY